MEISIIPTASNVQKTLPEEVVQNFKEKEMLAYVQILEDLKTHLQTKKTKSDDNEEIFSQLQSFYCDICILFGKIQRPEVHELRDPFLSSESSDESLFEITPNNTSSTSSSSQTALSHNKSLIDELKEKQADMQRIDSRVKRLTVMYSGDIELFSEEATSEEDCTSDYPSPP